MKKFKKAVGLLTGLAMSASVCMTSLSASAVFGVPQPVRYSENPEYDLYSQDAHSDIYYKFISGLNGFDGEAYLYSRDMQYVVVTLSSDVDEAALSELLEIPAHTAGLQENQRRYMVSKDMNCKKLYQINGVEHVQLENCVTVTYFRSSNDDACITCKIFTEPDMELTMEQVADTGFDIVSFNKVDMPEYDGEYWEAAYKYDGLSSYVDFADAVMKIDGVVVATPELIRLMDGDIVPDPNPVDVPSPYPFNKNIADMNNDGTIDITDASLILQRYADDAIVPTFDSDESIAFLRKGDVNGDGKVDINDATLVLTAYADTAADLT